MKYLPKGRLDAFADGVFAIVITLLVLDLTVPEGSLDVLTGLLREWPDFLAYLISFAFIGSAWIKHSSITHVVKQENPHSYRLTLLMLFFVSLLPFTTRIMATHLGHPSLDMGHGLGILDTYLSVNAVARSRITTPITIYGINLLAATLTMSAIMKSAISTPGMLVDASAEGEMKAFLRREQVGAGLIVCTIFLGLFVPLIAVTGYILVSILFYLTPTIFTAKATLGK